MNRKKVLFLTDFSLVKTGFGRSIKALLSYLYQKDKYDLVHLSTGDILRSEIKNNTELGMMAKSYIDKGNLVPDEVVIGMIGNKIMDHKKEKKTFSRRKSPS